MSNHDRVSVNCTTYKPGDIFYIDRGEYSDNFVVAVVIALQSFCIEDVMKAFAAGEIEPLEGLKTAPLVAGPAGPISRVGVSGTTLENSSLVDRQFENWLLIRSGLVKEIDTVGGFNLNDMRETYLSMERDSRV